MHATILGLGEWVPSTVRDNSAWPPGFGSQRASEEDRILSNISAGPSDELCDRIVARCLAAEAGDPFLGAKQRRIADPSVTSADAETFAARAALEDAGIDAKDIDVVLTDAVIPDHVTPPTATRTAHNLGATRAYAVGANIACASGVMQLELAAALIESGRARTVLVAQSFFLSRTFPLAHPASPNIGDAATAVVVGASERRGVRTCHAVTHGEYYDAVLYRRRGEDTRWYEPGGATSLSTNNPDIARRLVQDTVRFGALTIRELMDRARTPLGEIGLLAAVQPRKWIPGALAEAVGLPSEIAPDTFEERGHLGACGVVTNLLAARRRGMLSNGMLVALYAQGAGFTRAAGLLEWGAR